MPIYSSAGDSKAWEPAPEGLWPVVCVDIVDRGIVQTQWGPKNKVQFRWQLGESAGVRDDGQPWLVVRQFNNSLFKLADLCKFLTRWRGMPFTEAQLQQFDLETVLGAVGLANIVHHESDDGTIYANVDTILPLPKQMPKPVGNYIRQQDRTDQPIIHAAGNGQLPPDIQKEISIMDDSLEAMLEQTGEDRARTYQNVLEQLGFNPLTKMVELVQKSRPGKTFLQCSQVDQEAFIASARKFLKAKLDAEAAKGG